MEELRFEEFGTPPEPKRKSRMHRFVMLFCGAFMFASGIAAAYLAFTAEGGLPGIFYATHTLDGLQSSAYHLPSKPTTSVGPDWAEWSPAAFARAQKEGKLVLVHWTSPWCHECHLMDELCYARPGVRRWIEDHVVAVRVDSDEKPHLGRYLASGWPTTALLLPTGEMLSAGAFMPSNRFLGWAKQTEATWRNHPDDVAKARESAKQRAREQREQVFGRAAAAWTEEQAREASRQIRVRLAAEVDPVEGGFGKGRKFILPQAHRFLAESKSFDPLDKTLAGELRLMDPVWGGLYRYSETPDWRSPRFEKLLAVQAEAIRDFTSAFLRTKDERFKRAAERVQNYAVTFLQRPDGFYAGAQDADVRRADGSWIEGARFYAWTSAARLQAGLPAQVSGAPLAGNAAMAAALMSAGADLDKPDWRQQGLELAEAVATRGLDGTGRARHRLDQPAFAGLLEDEVALCRMESAALRFSGDPRHRKRLQSVFQFIQTELRDAESGGYTSAPSGARTGPEAAWPAVDPDGTAAAALCFLEAGSSHDARFAEEAARLAAWAGSHAELVEPALLGRLAIKVSER